MFDGIGERERLNHNARMSLAWHTAALMRTEKKMPKLETLLVRNRRRRRQSWQDMKMIATMLARKSKG